MSPVGIINLIIFLILIYFIFFHEYMLGRRNFKCQRCGKCCKLRVPLSEADIKKIKKAGYKDFTTKNHQLKRVNGYCMFLTLDEGMTSCKLEKSAKPEVCRTFPLKKGLFGKKYDMRCSSFGILR